MKRLLLALPLLLGACTGAADLVKAASGDQNSICATETSVWVNLTFDRNHGCASNPGAPAAPAVIVVSPSPVPSHVEVIRP